MLREIAFACLVAVATPALAHAEGNGDLFQRGKDLLDRGLVTEACETLAQAEAEAPSVGTIGLLAACHEKQGRVASAWREYQEAARRAAVAHDTRERFARDRADKIEPTVPRLVVRVPPGEAIHVTVGGRDLDAATLAAAARVDPGPIEIVARSDAGKVWSTRLTLERAEERVVAIPSLAAPRVEAPAPRRHGAPLVALVLGGVGVVGLGVMAGFGASAAVQNADSVSIESRCQARTATSSACASGRSERERARFFGDVATAGFVVGVAGLGAGALVWALDGGSSERRAAILGPGFAGVRGKF